MVIYLIGFALSLLLLWCAERTVSNSITGKVLAVIAILIPVIIAGVRGNYVGTDVMVYVNQLTNAAIHSDSFIEYFRAGWVNYDFSGGYAYTYNYEPGVVVLIYIVAKCFRHLNAVLFVIQLFITVFVYKGLMHYRDRFPAWLGMAVFYFMNYNTALNAMRQWMAMSILFFGIYYAKKRPLKYLACVVIASCFHISGAVCGIIIFIVAQCTMKTHFNNKRTDEHYPIWYRGALYLHTDSIRLILMAGVILIAFLCLPFVVRMMQAAGLSRYASYINGAISFMPNQIIMRLPAYILIWIGYSRIRDNPDISYFLIAMIILDTLFSQLSGISTYSVRITAYFSMFYMISLPTVCFEQDDRNYKTGAVMLLLAYMLFYWVFFYVYQEYGQTVPYGVFWNE